MMSDSIDTPGGQTRDSRLALCWIAAWAIATGAVVSSDVTMGAESAEVRVTTAEGEVFNGRLLSLDKSLELETDENPSQKVDRDAVVSVDRTSLREPATDPAELVLLVNGDVLAGKTSSISDDMLSVEWKGTEPPTSLAIPLEFVRCIVFNQPAEAIERQRLQRQWALASPQVDRMFLLSGTYVDGELTGVDAEHLNLKSRFGAVSTERTKIAAVTMNSELAADTTSTGRYSIVIGVDGSRVTLRDLRIDDTQKVTGQSIFDNAISLPIDRIVRAQLFSDRVVSVVELKPANYVFTPYLTESHPMVAHRNVHGGPLRLRGQLYATGLGVHSKCDISYDLSNEGYRQFTTTIGIDDLAEGQGSVLFSVAVDGVLVVQPTRVNGSNAPIDLGPIDVTNARQLTLSVDFGRLGNIRDVADWCHPLLLKQPPVVQPVQAEQ